MSGLRFRLALLSAAGIIWACSTGFPPAQAHAIILESEPRHGDLVPAPKRLLLRFNSRIEKPLCLVQLVGGPRKRSVALMRQEADTAIDTLIYALPPLEPGPYQARWKVMAADGHVTEGTVLFTVTGPAPAQK
ncbi:MAG TPA: copper resistance CopC family protein [Candidatus Nitrosotalea sp.]|jgi:methionine-rich copper-binding protein CopC|nr:copper resistance CopC family protein [Candidatus Nitrosotalea sp.]